MALPYYLKEAMTIPKEADIVISLLRDDFRNHRLKHIVPNDQIFKEKPDRWTQLPAIYVRKVAHIDMISGEQIEDETDTGQVGIGFVWIADIQFDIVAQVKTNFYYPPKELVGEIEENRYEHAKNCLPVIHWILHTMLSAENRKYVDSGGSGLQWDTVEPGPFGLIDGGYDGARDVWAIQALYRMKFEQVMRYELQGSP